MTGKTTPPIYANLLTYQARIARMLADPECVGDLFSLGVSLLDWVVLGLGQPEPEAEVVPDGVVKLPAKSRRSKKPTGRPEPQPWSYYAARVWDRPGRVHWRIKEVLRNDTRRYDAIADAESRGTARLCGAPMIRRAGPCNTSATVRGMLTDPYTGRKQWISACTRHRDWFNEQVRANRAAEGDVQAIAVPAANTGGVLARHIPEIDWKHVWKQLDPNWVEPPESEDEPVEVMPKLRLILGGS